MVDVVPTKDFYSNESRRRYVRIIKEIILKFGPLSVPDVVAYAFLPETVGGKFGLASEEKMPFVDVIYMLAIASDDDEYNGSFRFSPESKHGPAEITIKSLTSAELKCIETIRALEGYDCYDYQEALLQSAYVLESIADGQDTMPLRSYLDAMSMFENELAVKSANQLGFELIDSRIVVSPDMQQQVPINYNSKTKTWIKS